MWIDTLICAIPLSVRSQSQLCVNMYVCVYKHSWRQKANGLSRLSKPMSTIKPFYSSYISSVLILVWTINLGSKHNFEVKCLFLCSSLVLALAFIVYISVSIYFPLQLNTKMIYFLLICCISSTWASWGKDHQAYYKVNCIVKTVASFYLLCTCNG